MKYLITSQLRVWLRLHLPLLLCLLAATGASAQFGSDLGKPAMSTLSWDHISSTATARTSIGLTTDKKIYVWGDNRYYSIHNKQSIASGSIRPQQQLTPYFVPAPAGETPKKVRVTASLYNLTTSGGTNLNTPTFACLTESGKLYGWGLHSGLMGTAWPMTTTFTNGDTTQARRAPIQLTILGETSFVDFDMPQIGDYWIVIGTSGKAYHIGRKDDNIASFNQTFTQIPLPAGADVNTFKYVAVWCAKARTSTYLKGNDGKIYFTGDGHQSMATGIPEFYFTLTGEAGLTYPNGTPPATVPMGTAVPVLVPFPAGEDIVKIDYVGGGNYYNTLALSASGKGYGAGLWRDVNELKDYKYTAFALKQPPIPNTEVGSFFYSVNGDSLFVLKRFVELALPPGATKIIDVAVWGHSSTSSIFHGSLVVGDNNKTYWSGRNSFAYDQGTDLPNFIEYGGENISMGTVAGECRSVDKYWIDSPYAWVVEAINFQGASKIYRMFNESSYEGGYDQAFIISKSGKGYFQGQGLANSGLGKINPGTGSIFNLRFPTPIANELLDNCNPSPGTGGLGATDTTPAVGTIDCSKTQIAPAPVAGTPSQTTLMVTINVTTAGTFTPITVSGSGMSLGNGITSVSTTTTGVQTFYIPLQYDGSALTNAFQFTVGSAGSCTADLTTKPNKQVTNVWSLTNCSAITPGVLSK